MNRRTCLPAAIVAIAVVSATCHTTLARDMNGKFGLGFDQTLGGVSGISAKYWIGDFAIRGVLGVDFVVPDSGSTRTGVDFALGMLYNFARSESANLGIGVTANLGYRNSAAAGGASKIQFNVEIPIVAEVFLTDHFSLHVSLGIAIAIVPSGGTALGDARPVTDSQGKATGAYEGDVSATGSAAGDTDKVGVHIGSGSLIGNAGFTYYF